MTVAFSINLVILKSTSVHYDLFINCTNSVQPVIDYAKDITLLRILYLNVFVLNAAMSSTVSKGKGLQCSHPIKAVLTVLCVLKWYSN